MTFRLTRSSKDRIIHTSQQGVDMQAVINLVIVLMPILVMGVALIIMGEF
jgi:hypothetical protein